MDLNALKDATGLSNKKWDKAVKGLRNAGVVNVTKEADGMMIEVK